jgi:hypothetical protein
MDKNVPAFILVNEPEALRIVKPFYRSLRHIQTLLFFGFGVRSAGNNNPLLAVVPAKKVRFSSPYLIKAAGKSIK